MKKKRYEQTQIKVDGVVFSITLWGMQRKRVKVAKRFGMQLLFGGVEWDWRYIFDHTFESEAEARIKYNEFIREKGSVPIIRKSLGLSKEESE